MRLLAVPDAVGESVLCGGEAGGGGPGGGGGGGGGQHREAEDGEGGGAGERAHGAGQLCSGPWLARH